MVENNTEKLWKQLLDFIEEGSIIPVIGPELLLLDIDGKTTLLYSYLAEQLAKRLQINLKPGDTLNAVVCRYLSQGGQREDIYPELKVVMPPMSQVKLPEALIKLAEILPLKLFVTTSFDSLLVHALNQVRFGGENKTRVLEFSLTPRNDDLPETLKMLKGTTVFHLFGKLTVVPYCAVTDEDVLEFMHILRSRRERLFDDLKEHNIFLIIGCSFDDLLNRVFMRLFVNERLIISYPPIFLCESPKSNPKIFLSYAREDKKQAKELVTGLESSGWSVFWDPIIPPGKEWREILNKAVNDADCVIVAWSKTSINSRWVKEEAG